MLGGMVQQLVNRTRARQFAEENQQARSREAQPGNSSAKGRNPVLYNIGERVVL